MACSGSTSSTNKAALGHPPRPATGAENAALATEGDQVLCVAALAAHPQEPVFQSAAFEIILELPLDIPRHYPALLRQMGSERWVVLFNNPIEKGLLGTVALVTASIPLRRGRPGRRRVGHDPHPCDTVLLYSLSLGCGILKPQL